MYKINGIPQKKYECNEERKRSSTIAAAAEQKGF
jgi:hypothetical protein